MDGAVISHMRTAAASAVATNVIEGNILLLTPYILLDLSTELLS